MYVVYINKHLYLTKLVSASVARIFSISALTRLLIQRCPYTAVYKQNYHGNYWFLCRPRTAQSLDDIRDALAVGTS